MNEELERIKYVLGMYQDDKDKILFLLRQVEEILKEKSHYCKNKNKEFTELEDKYLSEVAFKPYYEGSYFRKVY